MMYRQSAEPPRPPSVDPLVLRQERARVALELEQVERAARREARRRLPLARIEIAAPCPAKWDEMIGDDKTRFCLACEKNVYDLTAMNGEELQQFLASAGAGDACVRIWKRTDGTFLRENCPVGIRRARLRAVLVSGLSLAAVALGSFSALAFLGAYAPKRPLPFVPAVQVAYSPVAPPPPVLIAQPTTIEMGFVTVLAPPGTVVAIDGQNVGANAARVPVTANVSHSLYGVDPSTGRRMMGTAYVAPGATAYVTLVEPPPPPEPAFAMGQRSATKPIRSTLGGAQF